MGQIKPSPDFMSETNHKPMDVRVLKKSISDKMLLPKPKKKNDEKKNGKNNSNNKFLITINVLGSAGPVRFVVNENDSVSEVIDAALKLYARQDRLPVLGSDVNSFLLYPANAGLDALILSESIGLQGVRNFVLCKKQRRPQMTEARSEMISRKRSGSWVKAWFNKSLSSKTLSH
ncbi:uncharacterized protein LOC113763833 [Coffea eugenioides]|uniref:uncharacterized protein LOC113761356 n=1 Tax=Coffea eugenioides TaxID=49369 RepID=UPI000F60FFC3|nr:uncharacterized protein LOC113761356 [Coffea eugenioides]XP_027163595.1 uncharacterized protein LOC113763833 [Coffea eugenioides]